MLSDRELDRIRKGADLEDDRIERSLDRVYDIARSKGAAPIQATKITLNQRDRMRRQTGDGDRVANGIRRSDAFAMRDRGDVATRRRIRRDASDARAMADLDKLRRMRRELAAIDRAIANSTGKTRRELKNTRRALKHRYDLTYGALARIDRSALTKDARDPVKDRKPRPIDPQYRDVRAYLAKMR